MAHSNPAASDYYGTLELEATASQAEIKQAYRRLAKQFHPDSQTESANHEKIARVNAAYEVLGDPERRRAYDQQMRLEAQFEAAGFGTDDRSRQQRTADAQAHYKRRRQAGKDTDAHFDRWLKQVYSPVSRKLAKILNPLRDELRELAADPFDDGLMENFQAYLGDCRDFLTQAKTTFQSMPNPSNLAGVAATMYYCMNHLEDGIEELERFTYTYDEQYLHTGQELFRISSGLRREVQAAIKTLS